MQLKVDQKNKKVIIEDSVRTNYSLLLALMYLNLFNAVLNLSLNPSSMGAISYLWIGAGLLSVVALIWFYTKKSIKKELAFAEIEALQQKEKFGNSRFAIALKNGKKRDLVTLHGEKEIKNIKNVFSSINIPIIKK